MRAGALAMRNHVGCPERDARSWSQLAQGVRDLDAAERRHVRVEKRDLRMLLEPQL